MTQVYLPYKKFTFQKGCISTSSQSQRARNNWVVVKAVSIGKLDEKGHNRSRATQYDYLICASFKITQSVDSERVKCDPIMGLVEELPVRVQPISWISQNGNKLGIGLNFVNDIRRMEYIGRWVETGIGQWWVQQIPFDWIFNQTLLKWLVLITK